MTFKHTQHWDSELSRSLEKVAIAKGLIKPEPAIKKSAAVIKQADTTPTSNLMENIFKLCAGMRSNGLIKEAVEVETNYLNYKSAQTLYEAFKETGDDVIQQAHPDGSHKMEDIDSDEATFEDILDKHVKILQVLNKKPTGKLSSTAQVLRAVRVVLGEDNLETLYANAQDTLEKFRSVYTSIASMMGEDTTGNDTYFNMLQRMLNEKKIKTPNFESGLLSALDNVKSDLEPSYLSWDHSSFSPEQQANWQKVQKYFPTLKQYADRFHSTIVKIQAIENATQIASDAEEAKKIDPETDQAIPATIKSNPLSDKLNDLNRNLNYYQSILATRVAPTAIKQATGIIAGYKTQIDALLTYLKDAPQQEAMSKEQNVTQLEQWVKDFATNWNLA